MAKLKAGTVTGKFALTVAPKISVGKTTVAGSAVSLVAFIAAAVGFAQGARDEVTLSTLAGGLVALVVTLGGRYGQAIAAILATRPQPAPVASLPLVQYAGTGNTVSSIQLTDPGEPDDEDEPGDELHEVFAGEPESDPADIAEDTGDADGSVDLPRTLARAAAATGAVSGLDATQRSKAREMVIQAAYLGLRHAKAVHYTQGPRRWEGIAKNMRAWRGQYPKYADCSSFATWVLWQGLGHFHVRDVVNGANWTAGYTGTQLSHGKLVRHERNIKHGDLALYDGHVAICVGGGKVISHGSEGGPYLLALHYRSDLIEVRRYI